MTTRTANPSTARARYFTSADGFNIKKPRIPAHLFLPERDRALDPAAPTGLIPLDLSSPLEIGFPATTPLILARYARIRRGERLTTRFVASGEICYAIAGRGETLAAGEVVTWEAGDIFCLPGGGEVVHTAGDEDCLLWIVTNEPELAFARAQAPPPGRAPIPVVHYPAEEIRRKLEWIHSLPPEKTMTGKAVIFSNSVMEAQRACLPSLALGLNSLPPHESQRPHRHNAVAVTLVIQGERCYSMIDGQRADWQRHAVMITPPRNTHSHHNEGDELALFLIVQDAGLHYHTRTMGFSYA